MRKKVRFIINGERQHCFDADGRPRAARCNRERAAIAEHLRDLDDMAREWEDIMHDMFDEDKWNDYEVWDGKCYAEDTTYGLEDTYSYSLGGGY